jgi:micrococcal nuclease
MPPGPKGEKRPIGKQSRPPPSKAQAARAALQAILAEGDVTISRIGVDKFGGRVDAAVAARSTADVSAAMLAGGFARAYDGGRRGTWCG